MSRLGLAVALALAVAGGASAEVVTPGIHDGMLGVTPGGKPVVAYVKGTGLDLATRVSRGRWRRTRVGSVAPGSTLVAFAAGARGPVAIVEDAAGRTLALVRRRSVGWQTTQLVGSLPPGVVIGWPGLVLDARGLPVVAYTRWRPSTRKSQLFVARVDARGRVRSQAVTSEGFPKSHVAPPAAPVLLRGRVHVIESYGFDGAVGTIEWYPRRRGWEGQFLDGGVGDFPVGPLFAAVTPAGSILAAWSQALLGTGEQPVALAVHGRSIESNFVLQRALTTALAATAAGPEVAANEWVAAGELELPGDALSWEGAVAGHGAPVGVDGWLAGLAAARHGARDLLLARPAGLSWFRSPRPLAIRVSIAATRSAGGGVHVSGSVRGVSRGKIRVFRERPGAARELAGTAPLAADGSFALVDRAPVRPSLYRAVYTDPKTGIPYGALLREPVR